MWWNRISKWLALRSYVRHLGKELRKRYGFARTYTPAQVQRTVATCGYNSDYICYALCLYCDPQDFAEYHRERGESCDYHAMRSEIADSFFDEASTIDLTDDLTETDHGVWDHDSGFDDD